MERVVAQGRRTSTTKVVGPVGRLVRDLGMPLAARYLARDGGAAQAWLFDHHIDWATRVRD
ncbi:hypothetical protein ACGFLT_15175 [Micromonospora chalcea]